MQQPDPKHLAEAVLRQLPAALVVVDARTGGVVLASESAEAGSPLPSDWLLGRPPREDGGAQHEEVAYEREDGSPGVLLVCSAPVRGDDGAVVATATVWVDVTGLRRDEGERDAMLAREHQAREVAVLARTVAEAAQLEAEAADIAKSGFLASMSHEIRTPLNAIMGYTELLDMGLSGPVTEAQRAQLGRIRDTSRHLLGLVNEVLDLAKIDAGETEVDREPCLLADTVDAALDLVRPQAGERGLELSERCESDPGTVFVGDAGRVRQIAVNLLSNAVKFTQPGGRVRVLCGTADHPHGEVFATHAGPWAFLAVEDNGPGIEPSQVARIFEPFVQAEEGHTRRAGGTGLGLTISRRLARLMGGEITVRTRPGEGSTFTLWLPAAAGPRPEPGGGRARAEEPAVPRISGIAGIGMRMLDEVDALTQAMVRHLREDPPAPHVAALPDSILRNHMAAFTADMVQCLVILEESPDDRAALMQDGSAIQRTIADRHGAQRHRLGWPEEGLRQEYAVLQVELEAAVQRAAADVPEADPELALSLLRSFVQQGLSVSVRAFRVSQRAEEHRA